MGTQHPDGSPEISVVIATYNRAAMLERCLRQLSSQSLAPEAYEVIVVNDGSSDQTGPTLEALSTHYALRVLTQNNAGQAAALNAGVDIARAPYCVFLDDDIIPDPALLLGHLRVQRETGGAVVMGQLGIRVVQEDDAFARVIARWWNDHYAQLERTGAPQTAVDCHGANLSVPIAGFLRTGGFATDLPRGYDAELVVRLVQLGYRMVYAHDAVGIQEYDKGWREAFSDFEREGAGGVEIYRRHPELLPHLTLGQFRQPSVLPCLLRRTLLALRVPPRPLAYVSAHIPDSAITHRLRSFLCSYAYWCGAQKAMSGSAEWERLTSITGDVISVSR